MTGAGDRVRVGITAYGMDASDVTALAVAAEECGFASLWLGEHLVLPVGYSSEHPTVRAAGEQHHIGPIVHPDTVLTDPLVAFAAAAASTRRLELGTAIYLVALRHPLLTARAVAAVQDLSGGRLFLGVGTGWLREEFAALGVDFEGRVARFDEAVALVQAALAGGPFEHHGAFFDTAGVVQVTKAPVALPIVFGGNTERALARAAACADGWFASGTPSFEDAVRWRDRLLERRAELGRTGPFRVWMRVARADPALVARYAAAGFDEVLVWADQLWPAGAPLATKRARLADAAESLGLVPAGRSEG
jgi:probable F420-dependent oxidoreductase